MALLAGVLTWTLPARADGLSDLESFLRQTRQGRASFTQVVTPPRRDGEAVARGKTSSGSFEFLRPSRFRFHYVKPFEQLIVADGQTLWLYDADLNQATARRQQEVLGNTPAALIATASDLKGLSGLFTLANAPDADGQQWVLATPKARDGQLQSIRLGFRQGQLATLEMLDSFGQRSVMQFGALDTQSGFKPGHFAFQPPAGADVLRQ
ncbi:outer membrane lipoprotein chaperone LolA [Malikia sp.]|uniref:outer membrane lipoprotein chaperone LolA n=1 Tax=Malikia sp. TaxID=2070706 RepID=UPI002621619E|nr:outer membrane lipoprotein chaperone LolA [Malikia sp.]MDD2730061.1 outer membrane lipoprotein chaperone LolA [Malikia sp.]